MTTADCGMVSLITRRGRLDVYRTPGAALEGDAREALLEACVLAARSGFGSDQIPVSDILIHAIEVEYGMYLYDEHEVLMGFSSAQILDLETEAGKAARVLYLEGTAIHQDFQGAGAYYPFIVARCALGLAVGADVLATRTANPIVCRSLGRFACYPFDRAVPLGEVAQATAAYAYDNLSDYQAEGGLDFDQSVGVVHRAYEGAMSSSVAWSGVPSIDDHFRSHAHLEAGDAILVAAQLDPSTVAALNELALTGPLEDTVVSLAPLALSLKARP